MGFFYKEIYGRFAGPKKTGSDNEVTILPRWPYGRVSLYFVFVPLFSKQIFTKQNMASTKKLLIVLSVAGFCFEEN